MEEDTHRFETSKLTQHKLTAREDSSAAYNLLLRSELLGLDPPSSPEHAMGPGSPLTRHAPEL